MYVKYQAGMKFFLSRQVRGEAWSRSLRVTWQQTAYEKGSFRFIYRLVPTDPWQLNCHNFVSWKILSWNLRNINLKYHQTISKPVPHLKEPIICRAPKSASRYCFLVSKKHSTFSLTIFLLVIRYLLAFILSNLINRIPPIENKQGSGQDYPKK